MDAVEGAGVLFVMAALPLGVHRMAAAAQPCLVPCAALAWLLHQQLGLWIPPAPFLLADKWPGSPGAPRLHIM